MPLPIIFDSHSSLLSFAGHFEINETTGVLTVKEILDRESMPIYHLNVSARNKMEIYGKNGMVM